MTPWIFTSRRCSKPLLSGTNVPDRQLGARSAHRLDDLRHEEIAAGIDPVQIVDQQHHRLGLGAQLDQPAQEREQPALTCRRIELQRRCLGIRHSEKVEYQRSVVGKPVVEQRQFAGDLLPRLTLTVLLGDPEQVAQ